MIKGLDHIGVAVKDLDSSLKKWQDALSLEVFGVEEVEGRGVKVAHLGLPGGGAVELISPSKLDSPIDNFLRKRGEGIHHICLEVEDISRFILDLKEKGIEFVDDKPGVGAGGSQTVFLHPKALNGVLLELKQKA
ncbi:methylmalonyl-CoA epimerase [Acidobacteriota bacterium]